MVDAHKQAPTTDYEANLVTRQQNFIVRAAAAVTASVTGVITGKYLLRNSLRDYLQSRLFNRDWKNGNVENSIIDLAMGHTDTISGAVTDPAKELVRATKIHFQEIPATPNGTLIGDEAANAALKSLFFAHLTDEVKYLSEKQFKELTEANAAKGIDKTASMFKEGFLRDAMSEFKKKVGKLQCEHDNRMTVLNEKFLKNPADAKDIEDKIKEFEAGLKRINDKHQGNFTAAIEKVRSAYQPGQDFSELRTSLKALEDERIKTRNVAFEEFKKKDLLKGDVYKYLEEKQAIEANFTHFTNRAKQKLVDIPIYDEMMKSGTQAGRMGLKLRHAHNRAELIGFSAGAAVAAGYIAYKATKAYVHRNDAPHSREAAFQEGVAAGREAIAQEAIALAMPQSAVDAATAATTPSWAKNTPAPTANYKARVEQSKAAGNDDLYVQRA